MLNVGVVLWSSVDRRLEWRFEESPRRLRVLWRNLDVAGYVRLLRDLGERLEGAQQALNSPELFAQQPFPDGEDLLASLLPAAGSCLVPSELMSGIDAGDPKTLAQRGFQ